jgi:hypothetical protein
MPRGHVRHEFNWTQSGGGGDIQALPPGRMAANQARIATLLVHP